MPSYRDVEMLNSSIDRLGDSLLRNRVLDEQKRERETARSDRKNEFDATRQDRRREFDETQRARGQQYDAQKAHWQKLEEATKLQTTLRSAAAQAAAMKESMALLGAQVREGKITNEEATQFWVSSLEEHPEIAGQFKNTPQFKTITSGKFDWAVVGKPKPLANAQPADVETDAAAAELEALAAKLPDGAEKSTLLSRAKSLRSGIGRQDPTAYVEETEVVERDDYERPLVTRKRRIPADQTNSGAKKPEAKKLDLATAQALLKEAGGDKEKARELARQRGYVWE